MAVRGAGPGGGVNHLAGMGLRNGEISCKIIPYVNTPPLGREKMVEDGP